MDSGSAPDLRELSIAECFEYLAIATTGHLAATYKALPIIAGNQPIVGDFGYRISVAVLSDNTAGCASGRSGKPEYASGRASTARGDTISGRAMTFRFQSFRVIGRLKSISFGKLDEMSGWRRANLTSSRAAAIDVSAT